MENATFKILSIFVLYTFQFNITAQDIDINGQVIIRKDTTKHNKKWEARKMVYPVSHGTMKNYEDALPFQTYSRWMDARHHGSDISKIGGGSNDLGDTIYCIGRGLVVYAYNDIIMILHKTPERYITRYTGIVWNCL